MNKAVQIDLLVNFDNRYFADATTSLLKEISSSKTTDFSFGEKFYRFDDLKSNTRKADDEKNHTVLITDNITIPIDQIDDLVSLKSKGIIDKVIVFMANNEYYQISRWLKAGVDGLISCDCDKDIMSSVVNRICSIDKPYVSSLILEKQASAQSNRGKNKPQLNELEICFLQMLAEDFTTEQIKKALQLNKHHYYKLRKGITRKFNKKNFEAALMQTQEIKNQNTI